jgi:hypothetical protein
MVCEVTEARRVLATRAGVIPFPAYIPVTTFGPKYPLDNLVRPYLARLAPAVMVSAYYARQMATDLRPRVPLLVDSGGFASLFKLATVQEDQGLGVVEVPGDDCTDVLHPAVVLDLQERIADVAFTLDFPIPPALGRDESARRQRLTIANAHWALANRRRRDLPLYAVVQGRDLETYKACARAYTEAGFDGVAIGGLIPRSHDRVTLLAIISAVRSEVGNLPLHVFGLGRPELLQDLVRVGVDSVDSSSYVQLAAEGRFWGDGVAIADPSPTDRLHLALCNLAAAGGRALPLSLTFTTRALTGRGSAQPAPSEG